MKAQSERPDISEMPPYRLGRHWNTIQAYLIPGIEDDIGEINEELRNFAELPTDCDWGCKRHSKGKTEKWKGYKLHLVVGDAGQVRRIGRHQAFKKRETSALPITKPSQWRAISAPSSGVRMPNPATTGTSVSRFIS